MSVVLPQRRHLGLETIELGLAACAFGHVRGDRGRDGLSHGQRQQLSLCRGHIRVEAIAQVLVELFADGANLLPGSPKRESPCLTCANFRS